MHNDSEINTLRNLAPILARCVCLSQIWRMAGIPYRRKMYYIQKKWPLPEPIFHHPHLNLTLYLPDDVISWLRNVHGGVYVERFIDAVQGLEQEI